MKIGLLAKFGAFVLHHIHVNLYTGKNTEIMKKIKSLLFYNTSESNKLFQPINNCTDNLG